MKQRIMIGRYEFEGPYNFVIHIKAVSGVYATICESGGKSQVLDVGEGDYLRDTIQRNANIPCWRKNCKGFPRLAAYYCNPSERIRIAAELREQFSPPCGG